MADYQAQILQERMKLHTTVFGQAFSPCGHYLAACDNFGRICVFSLISVFKPEDSTFDSHKALLSFQAHKGPIYSLITADNFLISGGSTEICGWKWKELLMKFTEPAWVLQPENSSYGYPETNALVYNKEDNTLFAGCGDNIIYMWDLETRICRGTFKGHTDYIQCLALRETKNQFFSGGEDGTVRVWDFKNRSNRECHRIKVNENEDIRRSSLGKWIGCLALNEEQEWMVCGGGPRLSLWHLSSYTCTNIMDTPGSCQQAAVFHKDLILTGGTKPEIYHWQTNGDLKTKVPSTATTIYSLAINHLSGHKVLVVAGNCSSVDLFTNFGYKALSLTFV
ncbi:THO complex subunit 6 homolog isoform X2 [Dendronephthya gigantea]|uniref:THO complex subunit 6 homolog isoform X2 n=1 Tax=Dendronephthya gigantea TaxID=151771 RepID=UPI00106ACF47|nr:THO complex subunit 6 homolog isoform X2 [Dendronephthya gigantea]